MEEASDVRATALELTSDVESVPLGERIDALVADASMTPGALTILTARTLGGDDLAEAAATRAAGVQLSYDGLRLARSLVHEDAIWGEADRTDHYLELLVSEVLVSRGFYHLARTETAGTAIETVRRFARNQTRRERPDVEPEDVDSTLETDVIQLAVEAGATLVDSGPPAELAAYAEDLARNLNVTPLPEADVALDDVRADLRTIAANQATVDRSPSADHPQ
jgi:hypothetical protein